MDENPRKEHICTRMVKFLENKGIVVGKWESDNGISNGYLRRAAKDRTNIGIDLIENFLQKFPEVDVAWLITGEVVSMAQKDKKLTAATNSNEAAVRQTLKELREEIRYLKRMNMIQAESILKLSGGEVIEQG